HRIGVLSLGNAGVSPWLRAWEGGMTDFGYVEGKNVTLDRQIVPNITDHEPAAKALVAGKPDVIFTAGWWATRFAKDATSTIPIVSVTSYPIQSEPPLVQSLARPGGNVTGLTTMSVDLAAKRAEIFKTTIP